MANTKGSDNPFPSILVVEGTEPDRARRPASSGCTSTARPTLKRTDSAGPTSTSRRVRPVRPDDDAGRHHRPQRQQRDGPTRRGSASQVLTSDGTDVAWAPARRRERPDDDPGDIIGRRRRHAARRLASWRPPRWSLAGRVGGASHGRLPPGEFDYGNSRRPWLHADGRGDREHGRHGALLTYDGDRRQVEFSGHARRWRSMATS